MLSLFKWECWRRLIYNVTWPFSFLKGCWSHDFQIINWIVSIDKGHVLEIDLIPSWKWNFSISIITSNEFLIEKFYHEACKKIILKEIDLSSRMLCKTIVPRYQHLIHRIRCCGLWLFYYLLAAFRRLCILIFLLLTTNISHWTYAFGRVKINNYKTSKDIS